MNGSYGRRERGPRATTDTLRVQVEQHIALGWGDPRIAAELVVPLDVVEGIRADLDALVAADTPTTLGEGVA